MAKTIKIKELKELIAKKKDYILIDVRNPDELVNGIIPTSKNIPLDELENALEMNPEKFRESYNFSKFSKKDNLIFYCRTGGRSLIATNLAASKGYNARNYAGSIWEWSETDPKVKRYGPEPNY